MSTQRPAPGTLEEQLRLDEGEVLHAYQDSRRLWTIGVGRLIDRRRGGGISPAESAMLLANDLARVDAGLDRRVPWWRDLDPVRRAVLQNMAFQLGLDGLSGFVLTLVKVRQRDYEAAAAEMLRSDWATQTPERAHRLSVQMRTGEWQ